MVRTILSTFAIWATLTTLVIAQTPEQEESKDNAGMAGDTADMERQMAISEREFGDDVKNLANVNRQDCVDLGATQMHLDEGDAYLASGDTLRAEGQTLLAQGTSRYLDGLAHIADGIIAWDAGSYAAAASHFDDATVDFDAESTVQFAPTVRQVRVVSPW